MPTNSSFTASNDQIVNFTVIITPNVPANPADPTAGLTTRYRVENNEDDSSRIWCEAVGNRFTSNVYERSAPIFQEAIRDALRQEYADLASQGVVPQGVPSGTIYEMGASLEVRVSNNCLVCQLDNDQTATMLASYETHLLDSAGNDSGVLFASGGGGGNAVKSVTIDTSADGLTRVITSDIGDTQPWDTHTVIADASDHITSDIYDYSATLDTLLTTSHSPDLLHIAELNEASSSQLITQFEREFADGGAVGDHVPTPSAYNWDVLGTGYSVFTASGWMPTYSVMVAVPSAPISGTTQR